mmetsp:Transcript_30547/g.92388  ORF Transcript_30547/g.92388 Transcript_30547/m.92388 type:complete len:237 (+) Transcript_30547:413-1123(+)
MVAVIAVQVGPHHVGQALLVRVTEQGAVSSRDVARLRVGPPGRSPHAVPKQAVCLRPIHHPRLGLRLRLAPRLPASFSDLLQGGQLLLHGLVGINISVHVHDGTNDETGFLQQALLLFFEQHLDQIRAKHRAYPLTRMLGAKVEHHRLGLLCRKICKLKQALLPAFVRLAHGARLLQKTGVRLRQCVQTRINRVEPLVRAVKLTQRSLCARGGRVLADVALLGGNIEVLAQKRSRL